jgi:LmbE family N-acetylglucosaminyl deacetylase
MTPPTILGVFAHPDDETIMIGGTLAMLHDHGSLTHLVCATRGEGGERGDPPVVAAQAQLGPVREAELRCAIAQLGVTSLTLLGYVDPAIGPNDELGPFEADFDVLVGQIRKQITATRATIVLAHGPDGEYGHPAHKLIHRATLTAVQQIDPPVSFYSVAASIPDNDDRLWNTSRTAQFVLDITPWAAQKIAAMTCHTSQHALFKRRRKLTHVREALRPLETFYREWPESNGALPADAFASLLQDSGARTIPPNK